ARARADRRRGRSRHARRRRATPPRLPRVLMMERFADLTLNGIATGAIYAAAALSLVLIWRATRILNFAQAGMLMITTFIAWALLDHGAGYWLAFFAALIAGLALGAVIERVLIRRVEGAPPLNAIVVTLGLLVLLEARAGVIVC